MATRAPTKLRRKALREEAVPIRAERVDRDAGIIRRVKILGFDSANGRVYLPECLQEAVRLYEGVSVRIDHPRKATDSRESDDVFGWLREVSLESDGLYGNLHYLKSHPMAERVCEAAERNPRLYGLSHNAEGDTERRKDGKEVVKSIHEVRSVDLVADPATTKGLFEDRRMAKKITLTEWADALHGISRKNRRLLHSLIEDYGDEQMEMDGDMPAKEAPEADHKEALRSGFEQSINAVVADCLGGEMDCKEGIKKIGDMLKTHEKLAGSAEPVEEEEDEDLEEDEDEDLEEEDQEGLDKNVKGCKSGDKMPEGRKLKAELLARQLCEDNDVSLKGKDGKVLLEQLVRAGTRQRMEPIVEREKRLTKGRRGRTQAITEDRDRQDTGEVKDGKTFAATLRALSRN